MAMLRACGTDSAVAELESVALTVKFEVALGPVGVPVMTPEVLMLRPGGNVPTLMVKVTVPAPPVFTRV